MYRQCSVCKNIYPVEQIEIIYDEGKKKRMCQYCLEDIIPADVPVKFVANYNRITRIPLCRLVNIM